MQLRKNLVAEHKIRQGLGCARYKVTGSSSSVNRLSNYFTTIYLDELELRKLRKKNCGSIRCVTNRWDRKSQCDIQTKWIVHDSKVRAILGTELRDEERKVENSIAYLNAIVGTLEGV